MIDNKNIRVGTRVWGFIEVRDENFGNYYKIGYKVGEVLDRGDKWIKVKVETHYVVSVRDNKEYIEYWYVSNDGDIIYEDIADDYELLTADIEEDRLVEECLKGTMRECTKEVLDKYKDCDLNFLLEVKHVVDRLIKEKTKESNVR